MDARLRRLVGLSAALTGILMVLGVYTASTGAGLTCAGRWPFCDGFLGLFPANWSSFVEWFHRLVAMITGFVVLGTTISAWRQGVDRRVRLALAGATILLPSQIILGALTVTTYEWAILLAHFGTASIIFTGVALAFAWAYEPSAGPGTFDRIRRPLAVASVLLPVMLILVPHAFVTFGPPVQATYYFSGLTAYAALLATAVWTDPTDGFASVEPSRLIRWLSAVAALVVISLLVVGRLVYGGTLQYISIAGTLAALALVGTMWYVARTDGEAGDGRVVFGSD